MIIGQLCLVMWWRCPECQKITKGSQIRVPLVPLPVMKEPFDRIAMDIVIHYHIAEEAINTFWLCATMQRGIQKLFLSVPSMLGQW